MLIEDVSRKDLVSALGTTWGPVSDRVMGRAPPEWREVRLAFSGFVPHRIEAPLDLSRLRRIGVVAIGRAFSADLRLAQLELYR